MHYLGLLLALPMLAASPARLVLHDASVTWGSGVEPRGPLPPARFETQVRLQGRTAPAQPEFRLWRLRAEDLPALKRGASPRALQGGKGRIEVTATRNPDGTWQLKAIWPSPPVEQDLAVVELWSGSRRRAWGASAVADHPLPIGRPRDSQE